MAAAGYFPPALTRLCIARQNSRPLLIFMTTMSTHGHLTTSISCLPAHVASTCISATPNWLVADSTIYEMEQRGEFPRRFALSPRCVVWDLAEVEAWLAARRASPVRRAQHPDVRQRRARPVREQDQARGEAS